MSNNLENTNQDRFKGITYVASLSFKLTVLFCLGMFILVMLLHVPGIQRKAGDFVIKKLADNLDKRIEVEDYHVSLLGNVYVKNLTIFHNPKFGNEPLGSIEKLYVVFNPLSIAQKKFQIKELNVQNVVFRIIYTPTKCSNLHRDNYVRKERNRNGDDRVIRKFFKRIQLEHIVLDNVYFELDYQPSDYYLQVHHGKLEGKYNEALDVIQTKLTGMNVYNYIPEKLDSLADITILANCWGGGVSDGLINITSNSGHVWLLSSCTLKNFTMPELDFTGSAQINFDEIAPLAQIDTRLTGDSSIIYSGKGPAQELEIYAKIFADDVEFNKFYFADFNGSADYSNRAITITQGGGNAYDGSYTGNGLVTFGKDNKHLDLNIVLAKANLLNLCRDLNVPFLFHSKNDASLSIKSDGFKARDMVIRGFLSGTEVVNDLANPFSIIGEFEMIDGDFKIPKVSLENTDHSIFLRNGVFASRSLRGDISGTSGDLYSLSRKIEAYYPKDLSIPQAHGHGSFSVQLDGNLQDYVVSSQFHSSDFQLKTMQPCQLDISSVTTPGIFGFDSLNYISPELTVSGSGKLRIPGGSNQSDQSLLKEMNLDVEHLDLTCLDHLLASPLHLNGSASGTITLNQSLEESPGETSLNIDRASFSDIPLGKVNVTGHFYPDIISNLNLSATHGDGSLKITGDIPFSSMPNVTAVGNNLSYGIIPGFKEMKPLGTFNFNFLPISEELDEGISGIESYSFDIHGNELVLGGVNTGKLDLTGVLNSRAQTVSWNADWNQRMLSCDGEIQFDELLNCTIRSDLKEFPLIVPVGITDAMTDLKIPLKGHLSGSAEISGPLRQTNRVKTNLHLTQMVADYSGIRFSMDDPSDINMTQNTISFGATSLTGRNTRLKTSGSIDIDGDIALDVEGNLSLNPLENLTGFLDSTSGNLAFDIGINGSFKDPEFTGTLFIEEFYSFIPSFDLWIEDYHSEVELHQKIGRIMYLEGIAGGSYMGGEGELGFTRYMPDLFDIELSGDDIDFEYPEGFDAQADVNLGFTGTLPDLNISGQIDLRQCYYTTRFNFKTMIVNKSRAKLSFKKSQKQSPLRKTEAAFNPRFGISILGTDNVFIDNNLAQVEMSVKLDVLGTLLKPQVLGHVDVLRGDFTFMQRNFELLNANIDFADPTQIDPLVNLQGESYIDDYRVTLDVSGKLYSDLNIQPSSSPPLNDLDLWNLMLIGKTRDSMSKSSDDYLVSGVAYVTGSLQEQIEQRFEYWMGFDEFSIDPIMSSSDESPSAKFTVKKRFGPDLSVLYSRSATSSGDLLLIEHQISDNLFILGQKTEDNAVGVDFRYRWEFE